MSESGSPGPRRAAIVTVGTELVTGILVDTNSAEIALALARANMDVDEAVSLPDDPALVTATLRRLVAKVDVVVVTGGLGPTHDDVTRDAAAEALGLPLTRDASIVERLRPIADRHVDARAGEQTYVQADVIETARVLTPTRGTAPGLVIPTGRGQLVLLPGPPREMRPMLERMATEWGSGAAAPVVLRCAGMSESDAQMAAQDELAGREDVTLTVLAALGDLRVILFDRGIGAAGLATLGERIAERLGDACYSIDGATLAETVLRLARDRGWSLACAESCTGGLVAGALTEVAGASDVLAGGVVAYANQAKERLLDVDAELLRLHGAVSEPVAIAMAEGARRALSADVAVSTTGIAGPGGGTLEKPIGTVWFAIATPDGTGATQRSFPGDRATVRTRAVAVALDLLRRACAGS